MPDRMLLAIPILLAVQGLLAHWGGSGEMLPTPPTMSTLPTTFGEWNRLVDLPSDAVASQLGAERVMERVYHGASTGRSADLFVAWFQSQRGGAVQPHSPLICLPGNGWAVEATGRMSLATRAGQLGVSRIVTAKGTERAVVLYWYQMPHRTAASEWESKLWLATNLLREKRSDIAMVRIVVPGADDDATMHLAGTFATAVYPLLRDLLPR